MRLGLEGLGYIRGLALERLREGQSMTVLSIWWYYIPLPDRRPENRRFGVYPSYIPVPELLWSVLSPGYIPKSGKNGGFLRDIRRGEYGS